MAGLSKEKATDGPLAARESEKLIWLLEKGRQFCENSRLMWR
jgi:hypothetical protein